MFVFGQKLDSEQIEREEKDDISATITRCSTKLVKLIMPSAVDNIQNLRLTLN